MKPYPLKKWSKKAYRLLKEERFDEAADCFLFLTAINPKDYLLWLGLGIAEHKLAHYEEAYDAYEMAAACELDAPLPYYYMAKCCFALHDRVAANRAIHIASELSTEDPVMTKLIAEFKEQLKKF